MAKIETIRQLCKVFFLNVGRAFPISWREKRLATNKKRMYTRACVHSLYRDPFSGTITQLREQQAQPPPGGPYGSWRDKL